MKYKVLEHVKGIPGLTKDESILSTYNTTEKIMIDYKARKMILDYVEQEEGKNYQIVGNGIKEK